jgi:hypothetical protein
MPRTSLPVTSLPGNTGVTNLTNAGGNMTAFDQTNGMTVAIPSTAIPSGGNADRLILLVLNTNATGRTITVRASTADGGASKLGAGTIGQYPNTPGFEGSKGDFVAAAAMTLTTGIGVFGPFEVARFLQPDNTISVDVDGAVGFISAFLLAKSF